MTIGIIGLGAAGMMAAATVQELHPDYQIILIEKNAVMGQKVQISGGGRCNVTTGIRDIKNVLTHYPRGNKFLNTAMYHFSPEQVYNWFEAHGLPLTTESDMRVFPQSNDGKAVINVFEKLFQHKNITRYLSTSVTGIKKTADQFAITLKSGEIINTDKLIITTGGQAYRHTGSTGDGYGFAESLGHHITPLAASLNSFVIKQPWIRDLAGVSFSQVGLSISQQSKFHFTGPIVFTHQGISGPAVFALSSQVAFLSYPLSVLLDFIPALTAIQLLEQLNTLIIEHPKQQLSTTLHYWLPKSVVTTIITAQNLPGDKPNNEISKTLRNIIVNCLKKFTVSVVGKGSGDEFVTAGGIELTEVNPRTMESKICPGLWFAGEILNIDGYTGGFNLQAAWATGHLAGSNIHDINQ